MLDDDPIRFDDAAMFAPPRPRPPVLAPVARPTPPINNAPAVMVSRCPQCGFAYGTAYHTRNIYRRGTGWKEERFCSECCGADYQMGCEG